MKKFFLCILTLALLSCSNEKEAAELAFKKDICKRSIADNESLFKEILHERGSGSRQSHRDSLLIANTKEVVSWRRNFINNPTRKNLLLYADSVEARHARYSGVEYHIAYEIRRNKDILLKDNDSLSFYNLLYFTSIGENVVLSILRSMPGTGWPSFYIPSYLDKAVYSLQDTVYMTISIYGIDEKDLELDLSKVTYTINESGTELKPKKVIRSGPNYILTFKPERRGDHKIGGFITLKQAGNLSADISIKNEFIVVGDRMAVKD